MMPRDPYEQAATHSGALVHYEQARVALATCSRVDEAASIRDKAEKLKAYARMRDDHELEAWVAEIHLRAVQRIGELSRELDKAEAHGGQVWLPIGGKPKEQALIEAGISTSTANRYEELAGGREQQGIEAATAATDHFFASTRANGEVPTMKGLKAAVREAVHNTIGTPPPRARSKPDPLYSAWLAFTAAIEEVADLDDAPIEDMARKATQLELLDSNINEAGRALGRLREWLAALNTEKHHG